jgi:hypothetical protein
VVWAEVVHAVFGILKLWNFLSKISKFQILKNTDLTKIIRKLSFRVLMCSNKRCILVFFKKLHTQNFEIWKFFEQKICKIHILNLGMAITLANCKLKSNTWCHFVRIGVFHITSYSKYGIFEIYWMKILKNSLKKLGIAITLAKCKLEGCNRCHFVRIGVLHMTSYSKFGILKIYWIKF